MRRIILLPLFSFFSFFLNAQNAFHSIGIYAGFDHLGVSEIQHSDRIRAQGGYSSYSDPRPYGTLVDGMNSSSFGALMIERASKNRRISLASGLKYVSMSSSIGLAPSARWGSNYFFYRVREDGTDTDYVTLKKITQVNQFGTVPLDVRWFPFNGKRGRFYVKASIEMNVLLNSTGKVDFYDAEMKVFEREITDTFLTPSQITGSWALVGGFRFGREGKPMFGIEVIGPTGRFGGHATGIVKADVGMGTQLFAAFPLTKKVTDEN